MKKFKLLSFLLLITIFVGLLPAPAMAAPEEPQVSAQMAAVLNAETGELYFQRQADATVDPNVLTQLMTLLLLGESLDGQSFSLSDTVTASATFQAGLEGAEILSDPAIASGEVLTVEQLLYLLALPGSMDAANILAEFNSGSVTAFVADMNRRAQELGCTHTHFVNPSGVPAEGQYSSAHDLALITAELLKKTSISDILHTASFTVPATQYAGARTVRNQNKMMDSGSSAYFPYAYSGKTGGITPQGANLMVAATYNDLDIVVILFGSPDSEARFTDAATLFNWVFASYSYRTLLSSTESLGTIPVEMGSPDSVSVHAENQIRIIMPTSQDTGEVQYEITYQYEQTGEPLHAPVTVGQYVGDVTVYMDGVSYGTSRLLTSTSSDISRLEYLRSQLETLAHADTVRKMVTVLLVILAVYLLLVVFYRVQRYLHLRSLRRARRDRAISRSSQEIEWLDIPEDSGGTPAASLPEQDEQAPDDGGYEDAPDDSGYEDDGGYPDGDGYDEDPDGQVFDTPPKGDLYFEDEEDPNTFDGPYDE